MHIVVQLNAKIVLKRCMWASRLSVLSLVKLLHPCTRFILKYWMECEQEVSVMLIQANSRRHKYGKLKTCLQQHRKHINSNSQDINYTWIIKLSKTAKKKFKKDTSAKNTIGKQARGSARGGLECAIAEVSLRLCRSLQNLMVVDK